MYLLFVRRPDFTLIWHLRQCEHSSAMYFHGFSLSDSHSNMNHVCSIFVFASALVFCTPAAGWHSCAALHLHRAGPAKLQSFTPVRSLASGKVGCAAKYWIRHRKGLWFIDGIFWSEEIAEILWVREWWAFRKKQKIYKASLEIEHSSLVVKRKKIFFWLFQMAGIIKFLTQIVLCSTN